MAGQPPASALTDHLGFWLRVVSNHVSYSFASKLAAKGVTVAEWVLLRALYDKAPMPPSRLAEELSMTRGAITKLSDRLIAKSLIAREANRDDARSHTLTLTASGKRLVPKLAALADRNDEEFFGHLSADERETLARLLKQMADRSQMNATPIN